MILKAPKGVGAISWDGRSYEVKGGLVEVPDEAAAVLCEPGWGFVPAPAAKAEKPAPSKLET
jgi:hypothetical protein